MTSNFGDTRLFFQHEENESDEEAKPEWQYYVPTLSESDEWGDADYSGWPSDQTEAEAWLRGSV